MSNLALLDNFIFLFLWHLHRYGKSINPWQNHNRAVSIYQTTVAEMHDGMVWFYQRIALENYYRQVN